MLRPKFVPLVLKQVVRQRTRSLLTVAGVGTAMFLFATVLAVQAGMRRATEVTAADTTLIVYRKDRFCPFTSRLPEDYGRKIAALPGVTRVVPMKIQVSNCRASLDVVTFRGVPAREVAPAFRQRMKVIAGSIDDWLRRSDASILGSVLATRRGLKVGDRFEAAGITSSVAAIFESPEPQDRNVAYVDLDFLQLAPAVRQDGIVTQFAVHLDDPSRLEATSRAIDALFADAQEPTVTTAEKAFVARAAGDVMQLIAFIGWVGLGCVFAVFALVANAIVLSVQDRVTEHAVLQTLGYPGGLIARLIVGEGLLLGLAGGLLGTAGAAGLLYWGRFSLSNEGLSINFEVGPLVWGIGMGAAIALGVLAGLVPAWQAGRRDIVSAFRS